jgi:hypothetical protein
MKHVAALPFDEGLRALAQKLKTSAGECHNFALTILVVFVVRLDVAVRDLGDHLDDLVRFADELDQSVVFGLEELEQCPDSDVLEGGVSAGEEAADVTVDAARGFCPILDEDCVITHCAR